MIISKEGYFSFADDGLLEEISQSLKYVPVFMQKEKALKAQRKEFEKATKDIVEKTERDSKKELAIEMAKGMKAKGYPVDDIVQLTGLSKTAVGRL